jgi:hypothetical protein
VLRLLIVDKTLIQGCSARRDYGDAFVFYRFWFLGHGVAGMRRNIPNFRGGIRPVRDAVRFGRER